VVTRDLDQACLVSYRQTKKKALGRKGSFREGHSRLISREADVDHGVRFGANYDNIRRQNKSGILEKNVAEILSLRSSFVFYPARRILT
jgi:hypothetical protein